MSISDIKPIRFDDVLAGVGDVSLLNDNELGRLCEAKQHCEDLERDFGILYYRPFPHQEPFHKSQKKVRMIFGANQCLGGEQEIYDPALDVSRRVDNITSDFHVWAWDGKKRVIAEAKAPFIKPYDDLYRFELSNGQSIVASMSHLVLTSCGYKPLGSMRVGDKFLNANTSSLNFHVARPTETDKIGKFISFFMSFVPKFPIGDDVMDMGFFSTHAPAYFTGIGISIKCLFFGLFPRHATVVPCPTLPKSMFISGGLMVSEPFNSTRVGTESFFRQTRPSKIYFTTRLANKLHGLSRGFFDTLISLYIFTAKLVDTFTGTCSAPFVGISVGDNYPAHHARIRGRKSSWACHRYHSNINKQDIVIVNISYLRHDVKYDFEVPVYHNYLAGGIVHHNSGKSISSTTEGILFSLGIHPHRKIRVPNKGRVVANDIKKGLGEVICALYSQFLPMSEVKRIKKYPGGEISKIEYRNGSQTDFLTYEQDTKAFEGWTGDWAQWDEPMPRDKYIATLRGLMRWKGITWGAMTPLSEVWIYDEIYTQAGVGPDKPDVFNFDIMDNPTLSKEEIDDFASKLTADEREARLHGRFKHLSGLVFKELKPDIHFIEPFDIPKDWTRYCAMDYHSRMPCAALWLAVDPKGTCYVYDELWVDKTVKEICEIIKAKEEKDVIRARFIDSISATPDRITGTSPQREFARHGLHFRSSMKNWILGLNACREYLRLGADGAPGIYFMRGRVDNCIHSMSRYQWSEYSDDREGEKESPKKKYAHFPDALRYILVMRPSYLITGFSKLVWENRFVGRHAVTGYSYGAPKENT